MVEHRWDRGGADVGANVEELAALYPLVTKGAHHEGDGTIDMETDFWA